MGTLLTPQEVADGPLRGLRTREWVMDQARAGKLPSVRLGRRTILFDSDAVDRWLAESVTTTQESA